MEKLTEWSNSLTLQSNHESLQCSAEYDLMCISSFSVEQIWQLILFYFVLKVSSTPEVTRFLWLSRYSRTELCSYFMSTNMFSKCQTLKEVDARGQKLSASVPERQKHCRWSTAHPTFNNKVNKKKNKQIRQLKRQLILLGQKVSHHKISILIILVLFKNHNSVTFKYTEIQMC